MRNVILVFAVSVLSLMRLDVLHAQGINYGGAGGINLGGGARMGSVGGMQIAGNSADDVDDGPSCKDEKPYIMIAIGTYLKQQMPASSVVVKDFNKDKNLSFKKIITQFYLRGNGGYVVTLAFSSEERRNVVNCTLTWNNFTNKIRFDECFDQQDSQSLNVGQKLGLKGKEMDTGEILWACAHKVPLQAVSTAIEKSPSAPEYKSIESAISKPDSKPAH